MKIKQLVLLLLLCEMALGQTGSGPLKFDEYSFSNVTTIIDPLAATGTPASSPDWIELRNNTTQRAGTSSARMQISGWYISDDSTMLHKWQIPYYNNAPIILDSGQAQMIFLCEHDKAVPGLASDVTGIGLHANFQVNQTKAGGARLYLTKSINSTNYSDAVSIRITKPNHSWGKCHEKLYPQPTCTTNCTFYQNDNKWYLYPSPTPGAPNPRWPAYFTGYLPKPVFDIKPGYFPTLPAQINVSDTSKLGLTGTQGPYLSYVNYPSICIIATNDCTTPDTNFVTVGTSTVVTSSPATLGTPVTGPIPVVSAPSATWTPAPSGYMIRAVMHDGSAMYPPVITATTVPSFTNIPRYLDSFETYGAYYDSLYKIPVTFTCVDTSLFTSGYNTNIVGMEIDYFDKTGVELWRNAGQGMVGNLDFFNPLQASNPPTINKKQWQFNFRAEDEYGYTHTTKYKFFQDPIVGPSDRDDFPNLIFRAGSEEAFMYSNALGANQYPPSHVRDYFNHTMTMRHKLDFEQMHYTPTYMMINGINKGIYYIKEPFDSAYTNYYFNFPQAAILANGNFGGGSPAGCTPFTVKPYAGFGSSTLNGLGRWNTFYSWAMSAGTKVHISTIYDQLADSIDFNSLNDYTIYNMLSVNTEYLNRSAYWWKGLDTNAQGRASKWRMALANTDDTWGFDQSNYNNVPSVANSSPCDFMTAFGLPGWPFPAPPYSVPANNAYPLMALWYKLMDNDTFEHKFLARYSDLLNGALSCDSLHDHLEYIRSTLDSTRDMASQVWWLLSDPNLVGYDSLHYWKSGLDSMDAFIMQRCSLVTESMANCFGKLGPYNLCVDVSPEKSGWVQLNSLTLKSFVWNGKYLDSVNMMAKAYPEQNYVFDHWETTPSNYPLRPDNKSDSIGFYVSSDVCLKAIFKLRPPDQTYGTPQVPTGFSPNGDGNNDVFNVYGIAEATTYEMEIYNRWGELIFRSIDKSNSWDGKFNGVDVPAGVYAYRCQIMINGKPFKSKGNVTLLR
ncbi:MAG: gliding motility-associated C-terminal domain-containing protein [Bacteroidia bacterium]